jgi:hypothetical protein
LVRRQEDLRRIDELRCQELDRRRPIMPIQRQQQFPHPHDAYNDPFNTTAGLTRHPFHSNHTTAPLTAGLQYDEFVQDPFSNVHPYLAATSSITPNVDAAYTTNQASHSYGSGNARRRADDIPQQQRFERNKRSRC